MAVLTYKVKIRYMIVELTEQTVYAADQKQAEEIALHIFRKSHTGKIEICVNPSVISIEELKPKNNR